MLTICPTPIGNLDDLSARQREALSTADIIACEDTRRTGKLLELLGIGREEGRPKLWRYDDHTARQQSEALVEEVRRGRRVVLVSDAGTPTISDPGYRLVQACRAADLEVVALPGPVAAMVALSASGLASDRFFFEGFLPASKNQRLARLEELDKLGVTLLIYESPKRLLASLRDVIEVCGEERQVCVARELTKKHEEFFVGPAGEVLARIEEGGEVRGEVVLCVGAAPERSPEELWGEADRVIEILSAQGVGDRTIKEVISELFDVPRSEIYSRIRRLAEG